MDIRSPAFLAIRRARRRAVSWQLRQRPCGIVANGRSPLPSLTITQTCTPLPLWNRESGPSADFSSRDRSSRDPSGTADAGKRIQTVGSATVRGLSVVTLCKQFLMQSTKCHWREGTQQTRRPGNFPDRLCHFHLPLSYFCTYRLSHTTSI
jgi:hypothetical protein